MRKWWGACFILVLGFLAGAGGDCAEPAERPNFVFFLVDDLGWTDLGCYGSSFYETPHLDRFAASAMRFTDAYTSCPVCSPTRASIMTGKYPPRVGITDWIPGRRPTDRPLVGPPIRNELALEEVTVAEALKEAGYKTFFAGKWHLGGEGFWPDQQGFDINKGGHHRGSPPGGYYSPYKNPALDDGPEGEYLTDRLAGESIRFLEENCDGPFFLYLAFYTVHTPIQACKRHIERFREKAAALPALDGPPHVPEGEGFTKIRQDDPAYASMVHAMDENVGRVLDKLAELGLADNTVVIFTSDNGGLSTLCRRGYPTCNLPLRAGKGWCYEGGIRVPLIIRAPGMTRPGGECSVPVTSTDFYPTILELAGLPAKPEQHIDGLSLVPLLKGGDTIGRDALFWHYPHYHGSAWKPGAAVRCGPWKVAGAWAAFGPGFRRLPLEAKGPQNGDCSKVTGASESVEGVSCMSEWCPLRAVVPRIGASENAAEGLQCVQNPPHCVDTVGHRPWMTAAGGVPTMGGCDANEKSDSCRSGHRCSWHAR